MNENDPAFELLASALSDDVSGSLLWVVDENLSATELSRVAVSPRISAITNRIDISTCLRARGMAVELSDFRFECDRGAGFDAVYFRVSKEKALVHHVINCAASLLKPGGTLVLAGCKNEGIKTYAEKAAGYLGGVTEKHKGRQSSQLIKIVRSGALGQPLDDRHYRDSVEITDDEWVFVSKPGLYGWNKIDQGSRLLVDQLSGVLARLESHPARIVDLGCGYGYLSVMAGRLVDAEFIATDNNVAAIELCRENFARHRVRGVALLADCAEGLEQPVDLVICNPPFHQGFAVEGGLTERFLKAARGLLKPRGRALFVVNSFIPIEKKARGLFSVVTCLENNRRFKVMELEC